MPRTIPRDVKRRIEELERQLRNLRVALAPVVASYREDFGRELMLDRRSPDGASYNGDLRFGDIRALLHVATYLDRELGGPIEKCDRCGHWDCALCKMLYPEDRKEA